MFNPSKLKEGLDKIKAIREAQRKKDPDYIFADVSKRQFDRYERDFKPFEVGLIGRAQEDTSLIDRVPEDVEQQQRIAEGINRRNSCLLYTSPSPRD